MKKEIVVNVDHGETRAALLEDRRLVELYVEREDQQRVVGNIYKGRVENVLPGMQAAFVDIGLERNAFLYVDDALAHRNGHNGDDEPVEGSRYPSIKDILKEGQQIIVQVTKEAIGTKGARVVTQVSLPGRYFVLMPTVEYVGISRRISDEAERARLKAIAKHIRPKGMGLIVRTVAEGKEEAELVQDCQFLVRDWERIRAKAKRSSAPALLYRDHDLVYRIVRDMLTPDVDKLIIDHEGEYRKVLELTESLSPHLKDRIYLYHEGPPIFESYGIEPEIERALDRRVWLDCGGYLVIDHTE
ncbi:MAG TPA: ribonuclease E/G, partial [Limnochordia bacterium]